MSKRIRPYVNPRPAASNYQDTGERIVEFGGTIPDMGGLISLRQHENSLDVNLYRVDPGVRVQINAAHLDPDSLGTFGQDLRRVVDMYLSTETADYDMHRADGPAHIVHPLRRLRKWLDNESEY